MPPVKLLTGGIFILIDDFPDGSVVSEDTVGGKKKMNSRTILIDVFNDTKRKCRDYPELRKATVKMQAHTLLYLKDFDAIDPQEKSNEPNIEICEDTTFHCAQRLREECSK